MWSFVPKSTATWRMTLGISIYNIVHRQIGYLKSLRFAKGHALQEFYGLTLSFLQRKHFYDISLYIILHFAVFISNEFVKYYVSESVYLGITWSSRNRERIEEHLNITDALRIPPLSIHYRNIFQLGKGSNAGLDLRLEPFKAALNRATLICCEISSQNICEISHMKLIHFQ